MPAWVAGANLVGGFIGSRSSKKAAKRLAAAHAAAGRFQQGQFDETAGQYDPYMQAGLGGLSSYEDMIGGAAEAEGMIQSNVTSPFEFTAEDFQKYEDPGYQFRLSEGERALNRGAARTGAMASGTRYRGLMDLGQKMASQEFGAARQRAMQDYDSQRMAEQETYQRSLGQYQRQYVDPMSRYGTLADMGYSATAGLGALRADMSRGVAGHMVGQGEAQAAGAMGAGRAWQSALSSMGTQFGSSGGGGFGGSSMGAGNLYGYGGTMGQWGQGTWGDPMAGPRKL